MGFFSNNHEDSFITLYVKINPGSTKAGARACLAGNKIIGQMRLREREQKFDAENPNATKEQREFGLALALQNENKLMEMYKEELKEWEKLNKKLEILHWEGVASGSISAEQMSPQTIFENSLRNKYLSGSADNSSGDIVENEPTLSEGILEKIQQLKSLLDLDLITQEEFNIKKKELLDRL